MSLLEIFSLYPELFIVSIGLLGLIIGSFLNVVIYRLPIMMEKSWRSECQEFLEIKNDHDSAEKFNLSVPASSCPNCNQAIRAHQNIPVISYLFLGGRCANCKHPISIRYPLVELLTGVCSAVIAWHFGVTIDTLFALLLTWSLIALSGIDIDHQLLPDSITLPILWLGLFLSLFEIFTDSHSSIIGAVSGYLFLWIIYQLFKITTGKEGMGYGDFKLLALLGAWMGWQYTLTVILLSSLVGAVVGISMIVLVKHDRNIPIPFGPYLAAAGWITFIWGDPINQLYLNLAGI
jgi:leader peptidase (prepilin peptidase)/N-methyltransferase